MPAPSGAVFYRGPSMIDGAPIVAIITGLNKNSKNTKTGALYQTWILREDVNPLIAVNTGEDASICGDCKHRGAIVNGRNVHRSCYVRLDTAPNNVFKTYKRGRYPEMQLGELRELIRNSVRAGSYGDPAAVPYWVWYVLMDAIKTAYTHQWRKFPELQEFCMASVDTEQEAIEAQLLGFRTFRVREKGMPLMAYEADCPASEEMGHKTTCVDCGACGGRKAKAKCNITIPVHGFLQKHFHANYEVLQ